MTDSSKKLKHLKEIDFFDLKINKQRKEMRTFRFPLLSLSRYNNRKLFPTKFEQRLYSSQSPQSPQSQLIESIAFDYHLWEYPRLMTAYNDLTSEINRTISLSRQFFSSRWKKTSKDDQNKYILVNLEKTSLLLLQLDSFTLAWAKHHDCGDGFDDAYEILYNFRDELRNMQTT